jgi:hypothetical protein
MKESVITVEKSSNDSSVMGTSSQLEKKVTTTMPSSKDALMTAGGLVVTDCKSLPQDRPFNFSKQNNGENGTGADDSPPTTPQQPQKKEEEQKESISFLLRPPVSEAEINAVQESIHNAVNAAYDVYQRKGVASLHQFLTRNEWYKKDKKESNKNTNSNTTTTTKQQKPNLKSKSVVNHLSKEDNKKKGVVVQPIPPSTRVPTTQETPSSSKVESVLVPTAQPTKQPETISNECKEQTESGNKSIETVQVDVVTYTLHDSTIFPPVIIKEEGLHSSRGKELHALKLLHDDMGPLVVAKYCTVILRELSRNQHEEEGVEQFENLLKQLEEVRTFCWRQCCEDASHGKSDKLLRVEEQLESMYESSPQEHNKAIMIVERKITALALKNHFRHSISLDGGDCSQEASMTMLQQQDDCKIVCDVLTKKNSLVFKYLCFEFKKENVTGGGPVQQTLEDETNWLHKSNDLKIVLKKFQRNEINLLVTIPNSGTDMAECSHLFYVDELKGKKALGRMKDTARQMNAQLLIFHGNTPVKDPKSNVEKTKNDIPREVAPSLNHDIDGKSQVPSSIDCAMDSEYQSSNDLHQSIPLHSPQISGEEDSNVFTSPEEDALQAEEYVASNAIVDLYSSKAVVRKLIASIEVDLR